MTIRIGEIGKALYISTGFDMSANTALEIKFVSPNNAVTFTRSSPDVTAPAVPSPNIVGIGVLPANTYLLYATQEDDFATQGDWCLNAIYIEGAFVKYIGENATLIVEPDC